jgi:preprotein translocase subunit SecF
MNKAMFAILGSLAGMLAYIWIRFQLRWGIAAVLALVHDTIVTLGLFSLFHYEMSLPVIAAFLTLIGYSVNDTVVVFDRVRENVRARTSPTFEETLNLSLNQTLSRTIITSGLTFLCVLALYLFGGPALEPFSFVLTVGIIVGSYSSISVAAPVIVLWSRRSGRKPTIDSEAGAERRARRVRTSAT